MSAELVEPAEIIQRKPVSLASVINSAEEANAAIKIRSRIPSLEGVLWNLGKGKWEVVATVNGRRKHFGYFLKLQDALWVSRRIRKAVAV
jgi:hypothetical protein